MNAVPAPRLPPPPDPQALWNLSTMYLETEASATRWGGTVLDEAGTAIGTVREQWIQIWAEKTER